MEKEEGEYELEDAGLDLEDVNYPSEGGGALQKILVHRRKIIFAFAILAVVLLIGVVAVIVIPSVVILVGGSDTNTDTGTSYVRTTTEYQISLVVDPWVNREEEFATWVAAINQYSEYLQLDPAAVNASVRNQFDLVVSGTSRCHDSAEIRVRDYVEGYYNGGGTVDSKGNSKNKDTACSMALGPSDEYVAQSSQKCEHDRHACPADDKYSRETRIFLMTVYQN